MSVALAKESSLLHIVPTFRLAYCADIQLARSVARTSCGANYQAVIDLPTAAALFVEHQVRCDLNGSIRQVCQAFATPFCNPQQGRESLSVAELYSQLADFLNQNFPAEKAAIASNLPR